MKALCAFKGLRMTDLSRATRGSAKTSTLANLADSTTVNHFSTSCVLLLESTLKDNSCLLHPGSDFCTFGYCFNDNLNTSGNMTTLLK